MVAVPLTATFSAAGAFTWTAPPGVTSVTVAVTGAGAGGGACGTTSGSNGGGGGAGEAAAEPAIGVTPGLSYNLTVGAAGAGGSQGGSGSAGGDSFFTGDSQTVYAHGGQGGGHAGATGAGPGGVGGTGSTNTVSADGGAGDDGTAGSNGGGGGGAAGASTTVGFPGNPGSGSTAGAGSGGTWPGGAGGAGSTSGASPGSNGSAPGGGGGGALSTGTNRGGGNGANGQVVITWTMTDPVTLPANTAGSVTKFTAPLGATAVTAQAWGAGAGGYNSGVSGSVGVAGFSAFTNIYGSPRSAAAATVDGYIGQPLAITAQVVFYQEEEYPSASSDSQNVAALAAMGCKVLAVFKCSRRAVVAGGSTLTAQQSAFAAGLAYLQTIPGLNLYVAVGNEPNAFGTQGPFGNGSSKDWNLPSPYGSVTPTQNVANFLAYWAAYVPTVAAAGLKCAYKPALFSNPVALTMFPGAGSTTGGCDMITADWYEVDYITNGIDLFGASNLEGVADANGLPLGVGEWGVATSGSGPPQAQWNSTWIPHFLAGFQNRLTAGKPVGDIIYFGGQNSGGANVVTGPSDFKCAGIANVYTTLNQSAPLGGAGGGGGEFAQESSLAITGLSSYTIAVGAGGGDRASGTSSTIAGDSVTVTAHGGSVATSQSAGGAGGTGSANTTHFAGGAGGAGGGANGGGGGGGGSGGTAAAGNAAAAGGGNFGGNGGTAVTGGGPGGKGGGPNKNGAPPLAGPGGGGGARGASGLTNGTGADGQITLSSFVTHPAFTGSFGLAPLAMSGTTTAPAGGAGLAPLAMSGTATVSNFTQTQVGNIASGTGSVSPTLAGATAQYSTIIAIVHTTGTTPVTGQQGWVQDASQQQGGGGGGIISIWRYSANPGGITTATFSGGGGDTIRANLLEVATPPGWTAALDGTPGTASGAAPATSFPVSTAGANAGADMAIVAFTDRFTTSQAGSWTTPANWTLLKQQTGQSNWIAGYARYGLAATTQSVTGLASTSTNQTGWAAALATYQIVPLVTSSGSFALAPLALAAAGNAAIGPGQVVSTGSFALAPVGFQSPSLAATFPAAELPRVVEILLNGTWTDISAYVLGDISITGRGRPNEASTAQPAQCAFTLNNVSGSFSPKNPASQFYPWLGRNTQVRVSVQNAVAASGAWYSGYRFWGEIPGWPPTWTNPGINVKVAVTAAGLLQRLQQSKSLASPLARYYGNLTGALVPAGYWLCEDGQSATSFASGIPGGSPMTWSGTPGLAADSSIPGSGSFAQLKGSVWTGTPGAFSSGGVTFAIPGTYQWVCPGGVTSIKAECWGAGGGGASGRFGCGGGGGEYAAETVLAVTPGVSYTVTVGAGGAGGAGGFSLTGTAGGKGGTSTFTGDTVTVTAHGGKGLSANSGQAGGGSGSGNSIHFNGGRGGQFRSAGQGGSGGGGSGGSGGTGNDGHQATSAAGAPGGSAVTGGGPGGTGGLGAGVTGQALPGNAPSPGPAGGGGGGGFNQSNQYGERGGNGYAGQVKLTFGTSTTPPANVLRFVLDIPSTGGIDGAYLGQLVTSGTIADLHVKYHTGGNLELVGKNSGGTQLFTSGSQAFGCNGTPMLVSAELTPSGTKVAWKLTAITPGATAVVATFKGTQASATLGPVTQVNVNNAPSDPDTGATGIGHFAAQNAVDPITNLAPALAAYAGELAAARFIRLCGEEDVPAVLIGNITDTPQMGIQPTDLLVNLLQDCETADLGLMFEPRGQFGLGYRTRVSMQNQSPTVVDYAKGHLEVPLVPTEDDQLTHNDILITRTNGTSALANGSSYSTLLASGPMSVQSPPNGVGDYSYQVSTNLFSDSQLANYAAWLLMIGTVDEFRYPVITFNLARFDAQGEFFTIASLGTGDFVAIINPPAALPPEEIDQLCYGFAETLGVKTWLIAVNAVPESPYSSSSPLPTW